MTISKKNPNSRKYRATKREREREKEKEREEAKEKRAVDASADSLMLV